MGLLDVLLVILILLTSALIVYLIVTLKKVNESLNLLQRDLTELNEQLSPILKNLNEITEKTLNISTEAEEQVGKIKEFFHSFGDGFTKFKSIQKESDPEKRIPLLIKNVSAVVKGISVFLRELKT